MSTSLHDQLDYLKGLAEDGSRAPIINGGALVWAGVMFGAASLIHYGFWTGLIPLPNPWVSPAVWLTAGLLYGVLTYLSVKSSIARYGRGGLMNKTIGSIWSGVGIAIFAIAMCLIIAGNHLQALEATMSLMAPAVLVLYGVGWWVVSALSRQSWLMAVCLGSFAGAMAISTLAGRPEQFLAYTVCLLLFATVPGMVIIAKARRG